MTNRAQRRAAKQKPHRNEGQPAPAQALPGQMDYNDPDAPAPPKGLAGDVFEIAALVNTVKATFGLKEETALKTVDLAVTVLLTSKQLGMSFVPPGANLLTPEEIEQRQAEASEEAGIENEEAGKGPDDAAPETHTKEAE